MGKKTLIVLGILLAIGGAIGFGIWKLVGTISKAGELGDAAVERFHIQYNAGQDDVIFREHSTELKKSTTLEKLREENDRVRQALGKFQSGNRTGVLLNSTNGDTTIKVEYLSKYEKGDASERFLFDFNGENPMLREYGVKWPPEKSP
jgi:hypothetical protein